MPDVRAVLGRLPRPLLVAVAIGLAFWGLAALNQIPGREFGASRYLLPGAVFVLMMLAGALDGYRVKSRYVVIVAAIAVIAIVSNIQVMSSGYEILKPLSDKGIAGLTALDIAGEQGRPDGLLGMNEDDSAVVVSADYFEAEDKYGSPAWSPDEIAAAAGDVQHLHSRPYIQPAYERLRRRLDMFGDLRKIARFPDGL